MRIKTGIIHLILLYCMSFTVACAQTTLDECIYLPQDKLLVEEKVQLFSSKECLPVAELMTEIGMSFLGTPYTSATLENGNEEKLVINLRELDCTTFVETCLALARTIKSGRNDFQTFASELEHIRYRNGIRNQYLSRLHYFSEWIHDNDARKIIDESPNFQGEKVSKTISFMSTHPTSYQILKNHPELISTLESQEKELSAREFWFFPKSNPENLLKALKHGDIIGLTSAIEASIDINHTGIIVEKEGNFYLLHGSQTHKKVVLSDDPILDFIKPDSKNSGVMIARPRTIVDGAGK
jgi:hypothetical protein